MSLIEKLKAVFVKEEQDIDQQYECLKVACADEIEGRKGGKTFTPAESKAILKAKEVDADDLDADVGALLAHRKLVASAERIPELKQAREAARLVSIEAQKALNEWNNRSEIEEQQHALAVRNAVHEFQRAAAALDEAIAIRDRLPIEDRPATAEVVSRELVETAG